MYLFTVYFYSFFHVRHFNFIRKSDIIRVFDHISHRTPCPQILRKSAEIFEYEIAIHYYERRLQQYVIANKM